MNQVLRTLQGKKSYIVAAVLAVIALLKLVGIDVPGVTVDPVTLLLNAAGLGSLRNAISNLK